MADDIGGVWRTIGGRRVFIKTGQSLSQAMKASGKFKKRKKSEVEYGDPRDAIAYHLKKGEFDKAEEYLKDYGLEDEREEFAEGLNYEAQKDYKNYLAKTREFEKATKTLQEKDLKKALEENARMNHQITRLTSELNTTDDPKRKEFIKATMKRYEDQVKENRETAMKIVQQMADREEVLPSEIQDRYNIRDSQLGIKADTSFTEAIERQIQEQKRYEMAEEAKKVRNTENAKEYQERLNEIDALRNENATEEQRKKADELEKELKTSEEYKKLREDYKKDSDRRAFATENQDALEKEYEKKYGSDYSKWEEFTTKKMLDSFNKEDQSQLNKTEKMLSNLKEQAGQKGAYGEAETNIDENYKVSYIQMASGDLYEIKDKDGNIARSRDGKNWQTHIKGNWSDKDNMSYDEAMKTLKSQGGKESALDKSMNALDRIESLARENKDLPGWSEERLIKKGEQMGSKDFEKWIANEKQNAGTAGAKTNGLQEGIPYKVKMGKGIEKQSIYLGKDENGRHVFYDGEGVTGKYAFSEDFIKKNNIQFDKDNNDPVKVNKLTQELKKSSNKEYDVDMSNTTTKEYNKKSAEVGYPRSDEKGNYRIEKNGEYQYKMYESLKDLKPQSDMNIAIRYDKTLKSLMKDGMSRQEALEYIKKNLMK